MRPYVTIIALALSACAAILSTITLVVAVNAHRKSRRTAGAQHFVNRLTLAGFESRSGGPRDKREVARDTMICLAFEAARSTNPQVNCAGTAELLRAAVAEAAEAALRHDDLAQEDASHFVDTARNLTAAMYLTTPLSASYAPTTLAAPAR